MGGLGSGQEGRACAEGYQDSRRGWELGQRRSHWSPGSRTPTPPWHLGPGRPAAERARPGRLSAGRLLAESLRRDRTARSSGLSRAERGCGRLPGPEAGGGLAAGGRARGRDEPRERQPARARQPGGHLHLSAAGLPHSGKAARSLCAAERNRASAPSQTIALIDAYDDPTAEADLGVFDEQFGLPACTSANGCFRKLNEEGNPGPLPPAQGEWASEISIDLQMAHAICQSCRLLLVEANSEKLTDLGTAVNVAASAGANEINNSYVFGPEKASDAAYSSRYYEHPGIVLTAISGDCGYLNQACPAEPAGVDFPASSPNVIAVGGTALSEDGQGWTSTVWDESGSGCSEVFSAPPWQLDVGDFSQTGCGSARSVADVAAVGDPETGVDIYDSTPEGNGEPTGWGVWGGTSVAGSDRRGRVRARGRRRRGQRSGGHAVLARRPGRSAR